MRQTVGRDMGDTITTDQHGSQDIPEPMGLVGVGSVISDVIVFAVRPGTWDTCPSRWVSWRILDSELKTSSKAVKCGQIRRIGRFPPKQSLRSQRPTQEANLFPF